MRFSQEGVKVLVPGTPWQGSQKRALPAQKYVASRQQKRHFHCSRGEETTICYHTV
jgi:hypothetical protein